MSRRLALTGLLIAGASVLQAAQPQFWRIEGARDFLEGDVQGLSVDSEGRLRLAPASRVLYDPEVPNVWCVTTDRKSALYVGTGNDGKVFKVEGGKGVLFFDAPELEVHALAFGPDGRLYVATAPDGKVYAVDGAGQSSTFFDPGEKYVWALAFDKAGNLFVATGAEGRIYRVDPKGKAQLVLTSPETHILSLALDDRGNLYAGSAPEGIVYRLDPALKVFVLLDAPFHEIKALETGADGSLYVAAVDAKGKEEAPRATPPGGATAPVPAPVAEVTVTETFALPAAAPLASGPVTRTTAEAPTSAKGALLRILSSGEVDTLWSSSEETPHALVRSGDGILLGTGNKGKLYRVRDDRTWSMLTVLPAEQVTALVRTPAGGAALATSNPGKLHSIEAAAGPRGTFTSKVKDTETVSVWGRLRWEGEIPAGAEVQIQSRSGNTTTPDSTWTEWSAPYAHKDGDPVTNERARFLQIRATLSGKDGAAPALDSVTAAYLQRNLRPQVQVITVHAPGEVFQKPISISGETEILGLEGGSSPDRPGAAAARASMPPATSYSRKLFQRGIQTFSWKADDPNGDTLVYDVSYRAVDDRTFRTLRKGLTEAVLAWDTSTVPNGRYVVRVTASDSASNPAALSLAGDKESLPFDVDNTPPVVTVTLLSRTPARVRAVVRDDASPIRRGEYSIDGGRWEEVHPVDGINDSREETYEVALSALAGAGPHIVVVRASDSLGNVSSARVEVP